jgi:hypothetical protein
MDYTAQQIDSIARTRAAQIRALERCTVSTPEDEDLLLEEWERKMDGLTAFCARHGLDRAKYYR